MAAPGERAALLEQLTRVAEALADALTSSPTVEPVEPVEPDRYAGADGYALASKGIDHIDARGRDAIEEDADLIVSCADAALFASSIWHLSTLAADYETTACFELVAPGASYDFRARFGAHT